MQSGFTPITLSQPVYLYNAYMRYPYPQFQNVAQPVPVVSNKQQFRFPELSSSAKVLLAAISGLILGVLSVLGLQKDKNANLSPPDTQKEAVKTKKLDDFEPNSTLSKLNKMSSENFSELTPEDIEHYFKAVNEEIEKKFGKKYGINMRTAYLKNDAVKQLESKDEREQLARILVLQDFRKEGLEYLKERGVQYFNS